MEGPVALPPTKGTVDEERMVGSMGAMGGAAVSLRAVELVDKLAFRSASDLIAAGTKSSLPYIPVAHIPRVLTEDISETPTRGSPTIRMPTTPPLLIALSREASELADLDLKA